MCCIVLIGLCKCHGDFIIHHSSKNNTKENKEIRSGGQEVLLLPTSPRGTAYSNSNERASETTMAEESGPATTLEEIKDVDVDDMFASLAKKKKKKKKKKDKKKSKRSSDGDIGNGQSDSGSAAGLYSYGTMLDRIYQV